MDVPFDLETFLPYRLNRAAERISLRFAARYRESFQMTRPEWRTLAALGSCGQMTATEIGAHSAMHKTKVSRAVHALEQRRWLKRIEDTRDRRVENLELTPLGRQHYRELVAMAQEYEQTLQTLLGKKALAQLENGLTAIETSMTPT
ncbi:MAG: MarR family winged helix-turn-helix transcriptional regulator [Pseudomonadota bacterium]